MQLQEMKANNFAKIPTTLDNFERLNQMNTVLYIENLAKVSSTRVDDWNLLEVFGQPDKALLVTEKNEINRRFFAAKDNKPVGVDLPAPLLAELKKMHDITIRNQRTTLTRQRDSELAEIRSYNEYTQRAHVKLAKFQQELDNLTLVSDDKILRTFAPLLQSAFWRTPIVDSNSQSISFETPEIILEEKNQTAGLNFGVNLGRFKVVLSLSQRSLMVYTAGNNTSYSSYTHPHVGDSRHICWGNMGEKFNEEMRTVNIVGMFHLAELILTNYNSQNPYAGLQAFWRHAAPKNKIGTLDGISAESLQRAEVPAPGVPLSNFVDNFEILTTQPAQW